MTVSARAPSSMTVAARAPSAMTVAERRAELAALLARAYLRHLVARECSQNPLADSPETEAPCGKRLTRLRGAEGRLPYDEVHREGGR